MCVLLALLLCSVIQRWHGVGFTAMCTQCARSAHAVRTQCTRSAHAVQTLCPWAARKPEGPPAPLSGTEGCLRLSTRGLAEGNRISFVFLPKYFLMWVWVWAEEPPPPPLPGNIPGTKSLICPDCQLVVDGVLGLAQRWRRHNWRNTSGDVAHADLWAQILELTEHHGTEVKWMHVPSHIGIRGNEKADQLADLGRRKSPLLFGRISVTPRQDDEEEERELLDGEISVWGDEEEPPPPPGGREPPHPLPDATNTAGHATAAGWSS